jgi:hypothetical protein
MTTYILVSHLELDITEVISLRALVPTSKSLVLILNILLSLLIDLRVIDALVYYAQC